MNHRCFFTRSNRTSLVMIIMIGFILTTFMGLEGLQVKDKPKFPSVKIGDVDGDGFDDFVFASQNRIFAVKTNYKKHGIFHHYLDNRVRKLFLGDFTSHGKGHGYCQVGVALVNNLLQVYSTTDDHRHLVLWFSQTNFIDQYDEPIIGDFDGDGADDLMLYNRYQGTIKLYTRRTVGTYKFIPMPKFTLGDISKVKLKYKQVHAGEFGGTLNQTDLIIVNPLTGQLSRYDAIIDRAGRTSFKLAFASKPGVIHQDEAVSVANLEGLTRDGIVLSKDTPSYRFLRVQNNGKNDLSVIRSIHSGNLNKFKGYLPFFGHFAGFDNETGASRDDILLYKDSNKGIVRVDARYDKKLKKHTYWWAFTTSLPPAFDYWPYPRKDKWLVLKCKFKDVNSEPYPDNYYKEIFSKSGSNKLGMYKYFLEQTYGMIALDTFIPGGWKTISRTHSELKISEAKRDELLDLAYSAWKITDQEKYKGIIAIYNKGDIDYGANSGKGVVFHHEHFDQNLFAHEMMHTFGFSDSFGDLPETGDGGYMDPYDILGGLGPAIRFTGDFGDSGMGVHGDYKFRMGCIPKHRVKELTQGRDIKRIELQMAELNRPECNGYLLVYINSRFAVNMYSRSSRVKLAIELRGNQSSGWDRGFSETAVQIRRIGEGPHGEQGVTFLQRKNDGPLFTAGETFYRFKIAVEVKSIDTVNGTAKLAIAY